MNRHSYFAATFHQNLDQISKIKNSVDPVCFYEREGQKIGKKGVHGWINGGLCPFHQDTSPNSFFIRPDSGSFHCFSCGAKGGDIISFVMQKHKLSCSEAIKQLMHDWRVL